MEKKHVDPNEQLRRQDQLSDTSARLRKKRVELDAAIRSLKLEKKELTEALEAEKDRTLKRFLLHVSRQDNEQKTELEERLNKTQATLEQKETELLALDQKIYSLSTELANIHMNLQVNTIKEERLTTAILSDPDHPLATEYKARLKEQDALKHEAKEIETSIALGRTVLKTISQMSQRLDSARRWASYDVWTDGGLITDVMKYKNVHEGDRLNNSLMRDVSRYNKSLATLQSIQHKLNYTEISTTQKVIDIGFDNLLTNLSVRSKIKNNEHEVQALEKKVSQKQDQLRALLAANKKDSRKLERQLDLINRKYQDSLNSEE